MLIVVFIGAVLFSTAVQAADFPKPLQGLWTASAITCTLLRNHGPSKLSDDQYWLRVTAQEITGTVKGRLSKVTGPKSAEFINDEFTEVPSELYLDKRGFLHEQIVGARASMEYFRCR